MNTPDTNTTNKYIPFALTLHGHTPEPPQPTKKYRFTMNNGTYRCTALVNILDAHGYNKASKVFDNELYAFRANGNEVLNIRANNDKLHIQYRTSTSPIPMSIDVGKTSYLQTAFSILAFPIPDDMVDELRAAYPENVIEEDS